MGKFGATQSPPGKRKKQEKIKLSKEQKIRVNQMLKLENRISVCREYIQLWSKFFRFFAEDIYEREIKPEEEKAFFQTVTQLARKHFLFTELMHDALDPEDAEAILAVLTKTVSLSSLKTLDETALSKLELDWHTLFLRMNVTLGRLLRQMPAGMNINEMLAHAEAEAKNGAPKSGKNDKGKKEKKKGFLGLFGKAKA